ncbi:hypothetical protein LMH87_004592 [Akanthomyces muscarius]|uniref:FAD/NAD(P)-binding domain-containing protein n=1 Tax=Akanthomyces muscarius TaxID=2231603 RepID=A0A9W8UH64_AKAMU|nr:hypothetical protein LMH87_004592 [Akanthomyces muscarius]KAJ4145756.1 hypothetical protein LMH87_004592 [Akanthomyces muscarius]
MKTIVVLGTGVAAAAVIRQTMKSTVLPRHDIKMVVVSPSTHFLWPIAMPRAIVPGQLADDKVLYALQPTFAEYPAGKFEFVLGTASALDPDVKRVQVALGGDEGATRDVAYDVLVIATGAASRDDMPWKPLDTTESTVAKLRSVQKQIEDAETIVVAGGGITGVETVGELGYEYSRTGRKKVYFVHADALPLASPVMESVRKQTRAELAKLKVQIVPSTKVTKVTASGADTVLELTAANGKTTTLKTQAYIPALGVVPNTAFVPARMLNAGGYVKQTTALQTEDHEDIFVIGDAGSLEGNRAAMADAQAKHLIEALPLHLDGKTLPEYKPATKDMFGITLGRGRGTGQVGSFKIFSILIWYVKGRFLGTDYADHLAAGKRTLTTKFE